ncbi:MAG TPA: hypothetical protein ENF30_02610 [Candidatus Desulfofervidus auxilii]|uniref:Uncharacterized protein n=1 Tax=Desulfofervidus auxilii TaxID=1621989 RepID=A0A7V0IAF2_DESA2|nr:hypothetical protein [Candidatus Desulfofervidus auxilii]
MGIKEFYKTHFGMENLFLHQKHFWDLALSNKFPILVKAPTGSGKTKEAEKVFKTAYWLKTRLKKKGQKWNVRSD